MIYQPICRPQPITIIRVKVDPAKLWTTQSLGDTHAKSADALFVGFELPHPPPPPQKKKKKKNKKNTKQQKTKKFALDCGLPSSLHSGAVVDNIQIYLFRLNQQKRQEQSTCNCRSKTSKADAHKANISLHSPSLSAGMPGTVSPDNSNR